MGSSDQATTQGSSFLPFRTEERAVLDFDYFPESLGRQNCEDWLSFIVRNQNLSAISLKSNSDIK